MREALHTVARKKSRAVLNFAYFDSLVCIVVSSREKSRSLSLAPFLARYRSLSLTGLLLLIYGGNVLRSQKAEGGNVRAVKMSEGKTSAVNRCRWNILLWVKTYRLDHTHSPSHAHPRCFSILSTHQSFAPSCYIHSFISSLHVA